MSLVLVQVHIIAHTVIVLVTIGTITGLQTDAVLLPQHKLGHGSIKTATLCQEHCCMLSLQTKHLCYDVTVCSQ